MKQIIFIFFLFVNVSFASDDLRMEDKIRIRESIKILDHCKGIWNGWNETQFAVLLVTDSIEYLINHNNPTADFQLSHFDTLLNSNIYTRPKTFNSSLLATFPAVNGLSTIVIGTPENTGKSGIEWVITMLHEHFHQFQYSDENYLANVDALDLAGEDKTGMWMLNYNFPYEDELISKQYQAVILSVKNALLNANSSDFDSLMKSYLTEREKFKSLLNENDYKYFSFQVWQEGIARYTELKIAECLKNGYTFSEAFRNIENINSTDSIYENVYRKQIARADNQILSKDKRNCFYTLGAIEGMLADVAKPEWRNRYLNEMFYMEKYFR